MGVAARASVAMLAVVVLAWLGVLERDDRLLRRGVEISGHVQGTDDAASAEAAFRGARFLNPDTSPDVGRAVLYQGRGEPERAVALLRDVLNREPDNLTAWGLLLGLSRGVDPATERRALEARQRLDPLNARPRRAR